MKKVIFLSGVSGVGKSTAGKALGNKPVSVVELDSLVRAFYSRLKVGSDTTNPYRFDDWEKFLSIHKNNVVLLNAFQEFILHAPPEENVNLLLIGNHFLLPSFEQTLSNTLTPLGFEPAIKLLLDLNWKKIYFYRKKRGTFRDKQSSMKDVISQISHYRSVLHPRGYISVKTKQFHTILRNYFQIS
ncbi:MAG TPA: hypothetical protein PK530_09140 [Anaerolineales bacterium]|nr:hypothetical protein [Anaerolineales bacterium]